MSIFFLILLATREVKKNYEKGAKTVEENIKRKTETGSKTNMEGVALSVKHGDIKRSHISRPPKKDLLSCAFPDCSWDISVLSICLALEVLLCRGE